MTRLFKQIPKMLPDSDQEPIRYLTNKEIRDLARQFFLQEINREEIYRVNAQEFDGVLTARTEQRMAEEKKCPSSEFLRQVR